MFRTYCLHIRFRLHHSQLTALNRQIISLQQSGVDIKFTKNNVVNHKSKTPFYLFKKIRKVDK